MTTPNGYLEAWTVIYYYNTNYDPKYYIDLYLHSMFVAGMEGAIVGPGNYCFLSYKTERDIST